MADKLEWKIEAPAGVATVTLTGAVTERGQLGELAAQIASATRLTFDLSGVRRFNSNGVRTWVEMVAALPATTEVAFVRCSPAVVHQLNLVRGFAGRATVRSIRVPYICDACGATDVGDMDVVYGGHSTTTPVPPRACPKCGRAMELDDLPETYFAFLVARRDT